MKAELLDRSEVTAALETTMIAVRNIVEGSNFSEQDKRDLLNNIAAPPVMVENIAIQRRSKVPDDRREGQEGKKAICKRKAATGGDASLRRVDPYAISMGTGLKPALVPP
jgi:hypothetical protein